MLQWYINSTKYFNFIEYHCYYVFGFIWIHYVFPGRNMSCLVFALYLEKASILSKNGGFLLSNI